MTPVTCLLLPGLIAASPVSAGSEAAFTNRQLGALTHAMAIELTDIAYLIRGLVNVCDDHVVFHRTDRAVADLEEARRLSAAHARAPYAARIVLALGDGYWRLNRPGRARDVWREGLAAFPKVEGFGARLRATDRQVADIIERALDAGGRVDTTVGELCPDGTRTAGRGQP